MKKVYIDVTMVVRGISYTGIPRVVMEVSKELNKSKEMDLVFLEYDEAKRRFRILNKDAFIRLCNNTSSDRRNIRTDRRIHPSDFEEGSVFFDMDGIWKSRCNRTFLYPVLKKCGVRIISFIQDIIMVTHPQFCREDDILTFLEYVGAVMLYADRILVTTKTTKNYMTKVYGDINKGKCLSDKRDFVDRIDIVPLGADFKRKAVDTNKEKSLSSDVEAMIKKKKPYLVMVGTIEPRKNQELLIEAYEKGLNKLGINVVIAGHPGWHTERLLKRIEEHPDLGNGIYYFDNAKDEDIEALYKNSFALAFPSYIEGYGLPIMEAMYHGVPLLLSDTSINHEMAGDKALYFGADSPEELVELVGMIIDNKDEYNRLRNVSVGFKVPKWEETGRIVEKNILQS